MGRGVLDINGGRKKTIRSMQSVLLDPGARQTKSSFHGSVGALGLRLRRPTLRASTVVSQTIYRPSGAGQVIWHGCGITSQIVGQSRRRFGDMPSGDLLSDKVGTDHSVREPVAGAGGRMRFIKRISMLAGAPGQASHAPKISGTT